jgi:hypothetical protein
MATLRLLMLWKILMKNEILKHLHSAKMPTSTTGLSLVPGLLCLLMSLTLAGCDEKDIPTTYKANSGSGSVEVVDLTIVGYNYTDREIAGFTVNGYAGGTLHVSGPYGGGGGSVCCVKYVAGHKAREFQIRWHATSCRYGETGSGASYTYDLHRTYTQRTVEVEKQSVDKSKYLEVHFFPDGSIKARVTGEMSPPILSLPVEREAEGSPQCPNNVKPQ